MHIFKINPDCTRNHCVQVFTSEIRSKLFLTLLRHIAKQSPRAKTLVRCRVDGGWQVMLIAQFSIFFLYYVHSVLTPGGNGCLSNIARGWLKAGVAMGDGTGIRCGWVMLGFTGGLLFTSAPAIISVIRFTATESKIKISKSVHEYSRTKPISCTGLHLV